MPKNKIYRTQLPNGCSCSQISVSPQNWKQAKKISGPWRIHFRFYDPVNGQKQIVVKAMNFYKTVGERKEAVEIALANIEQQLKAGYNPFYKKVVQKRDDRYDIEPTTLFIPALKKVLQRITLDPAYKKHIESYIIPNVEKAAIALNMQMMFISEVKRKHIIFILDHLRETNKGFSDNTFNRFRTDLKILFEELVNIEAVENNIISFKPLAWEPKQRETLTPSERKYLDELLFSKYPEFHRYLNIFFHSGARSTELLRLKGSDVNLQEQKYKTQIRKGKKYRTVWRPIKNIALSYWMEQMKNCGPDDFVFSKGLNPGAVAITPKQITRRWFSLVKKKFVYNAGRKSGKGKYVDRVHIIDGKETIITADFYALKHLNTTEIVDHLNEEAAAQINGHTSSAMVVKIYDQKQQDRRAEKLKRVNNPFA